MHEGAAPGDQRSFDQVVFEQRVEARAHCETSLLLVLVIAKQRCHLLEKCRRYWHILGKASKEIEYFAQTTFVFPSALDHHSHGTGYDTRFDCHTVVIFQLLLLRHGLQDFNTNEKNEKRGPCIELDIDANQVVIYDMENKAPKPTNFRETALSFLSLQATSHTQN